MRNKNSRADPPSKVEVSYDFDTQTLDVTITHSVGNPNEHYVYKVEITKNSGSPIRHSYSSQPSDYQWTYSYDVPAENGDTLKAQAFCNEGGDRSASLTVEHTDRPMDLFARPEITIIDENSTLDLTLTIESGSKPVEGVHLSISALFGGISGISEIGAGDYSFRFTAPEVGSDISETINITASKNGYVTSYLDFIFTIHNLLENASTINITVFPEVVTIDEGSNSSFTVSIESMGAPLEEGIMAVVPTYGDVSGINEPGGGDYGFFYNAPEVNGDVLETINISISKEGFETAYQTFDFTIIDGLSSQHKICIFLIPDTDSIERGSTINFTISLEAGCEPLNDSNVQVQIGHLFGAVTNAVNSGDGNYKFSYYALEDNEGESEVITISVSREGYRSNEKDFTFTIIEPVTPPAGGGELEGIISQGEYDFMASFGGGDFEVHWRIEGDIITFALLGRTTGWVSLGLDPKQAMDEADMILAWVDDDGEVHIVDAYSTGPTGPHPPDTELGGTDDILAYGGSEQDGVTIIEFQRKLSTGDEYDKDIPRAGKLKVIWSNGPTDEFYRIHDDSQVGTGYIVMDTGQVEEEDDVELWPAHATFMTMGLLLMITALYVARFRKKEKWWMKYHRTLGIIGSSTTIVGLFIGFSMVEQATGEHFRINHSIGGFITILLATMTPIIGLLMFRFGKQIKQMKLVHRWLGRLTVLMMILVVISALQAAGVI